MIKTDVVIIGAGPVGLFVVHQLGIKGLKSEVIDNLDKAQKLLKEFDGVMVGRLIKNNPFILKDVDKKIFKEKNKLIDETIINNYFEELDKVFSLIQKCEDGYNIKKLLKYPVSISGFQRLN